jgi:ADP-ribose pyrophosphatase YjhB (NUDIX family)
MPAAPPVQPSHPQLAVSAAIFRDDRILLVRRARSPAKGFYSLPGGRVEFGETLHAALHREVDEETALEIDIVGLAGWREVVPGTAGGGHYLIMSFAARWRAGEPVLNDELDDFRWLAPDALGDLKLTGGLQDVIRAARNLLRV